VHGGGRTVLVSRWRTMLDSCVPGNQLDAFSSSCRWMSIKELASSTPVSSHMQVLSFSRGCINGPEAHMTCVAYRVEAQDLHLFPSRKETCHCLLQGQGEQNLPDDNDAHG
jgi:hypothetical protein